MAVAFTPNKLKVDNFDGLDSLTEAWGFVKWRINSMLVEDSDRPEITWDVLK